MSNQVLELLRRIWSSIDSVSQDAILDEFGTPGKLANVARKATGAAQEAAHVEAQRPRRGPPRDDDDVIDADWEAVDPK